MRKAPLLLALSLGCSGTTNHGPPPALSGTLLGFDAAAVAAANAANLPAGFSGPQRTVCAKDTTRGFIAEVIDHGFLDTQVTYQWAPIVPGADPLRPTLGQPEFFLSGTIRETELSALDLRPTHPFAFDRTWDMAVDPSFEPFVSNRPTDDPTVLHAELETALFPESAFGFTPQPGDRVLVGGNWIYDCGHPEYEAEVHPPSFVAMARLEGAATVSLAFGNPYRPSQLFGPPTLATAFDQPLRYFASGVAPFIGRLKEEVAQAVLKQIDHLEMHPLVDATQVASVTWFVCAPEPRPPSAAALFYSYRFVTRTGVTITAARRGDSGCVEFHAQMDGSYQPAAPQMTDQPWPWAKIDQEAEAQVGQPVDVRQTIVSALAGAGITGDIPALDVTSTPIVARFAPLAPRPGADQDAPTAVIDKADDQPFPFYGRARVQWL